MVVVLGRLYTCRQRTTRISVEWSAPVRSAPQARPCMQDLPFLAAFRLAARRYAIASRR